MNERHNEIENLRIVLFSSIFEWFTLYSLIVFNKIEDRYFSWSESSDLNFVLNNVWKLIFIWDLTRMKMMFLSIGTKIHSNWIVREITLCKQSTSKFCVYSQWIFWVNLIRLKRSLIEIEGLICWSKSLCIIWKTMKKRKDFRWYSFDKCPYRVSYWKSKLSCSCDSCVVRCENKDHQIWH